MFLDEAVVELISGRGGSGAVSFHREKFVPRGGPDGADGGKGGDVILIAERGKRTLYDFKLHPKVEAAPGEHGVSNKRGRDGKGVIVKVPVGTVVTDTETGDFIADMAVDGMKVVVCKGGKGGKGNQHYANSVRQAPNFAQKGGPHERVLAKFELKLLADVGIVGKPNAGKSTLISRISAAKPKIADYPFTTIIPNLGVVNFRNETFVVADMPGLIEGASDGVGLGIQFLKHVERCRVLIHLVDVLPVDDTDPVANYELIERELKNYSEEIWARPRLLVLNKIDLLNAEERDAVHDRFKDFGLPLFSLSAVTGKGVEPVLDACLDILKKQGDVELPILVPTIGKVRSTDWSVVKSEEGFEVVGDRILRMIAMTDLENSESVYYLQRRLDRVGVFAKLREMGVEEGDSVIIGDLEFAFTDQA